MLDYVIVGLIVLASFIFFIKAFIRKIKEKSSGKCQGSSSCNSCCSGHLRDNRKSEKK
ncbi:MAG TPA: FeoB-associated Cys-rich membrane protein [Candidatus Eremiobacteraeota bacterium]|nr:MAG: Virus attachment protein p12 family protein [bacterium ADurb.Bin363]HPZ08313.1 FeoB-associated Cys-rich membrane protein [Candidatus Eremiobacteraeota bacterium]